MRLTQTNSKSFSSMFLLAPLSFLAIDAFAVGSVGVGAGGGGNALVCFNKDGTIKNAELLDLAEGRLLYNWRPKASQGSELERAISAAKTIWPGEGIASDLSGEVESIAKTIRFLPGGTALVPIADSNSVITAENCKIEQLARYAATGDVFINSDIWKQLKVESRAALYVHEAFYHFMRIMGDTTSDRTRRVVAAAFAGQRFLSINDDLPVRNYESCTTKGPDDHSADSLPWASFFTHPNPDGSISIQFLALNGLLMVSKTTLELSSSTYPLDSHSQPYPMDFGRLNSIADRGLQVAFSRSGDGGADSYLEISSGEYVEGIETVKHRVYCQRIN